MGLRASDSRPFCNGSMMNKSPFDDASPKQAGKNPWLFLTLLVLVTFFWPLALLADESQKGRELAQRVYDRPTGADMTTRGSMILTEAGRSPRVRELVTYQKDYGDGRIATLIRFMSPGDIADTGLLTLDHTDGTSDQWVYLPALGNSRRIPSGRQGGRFVGSDLLFEDLQDRKVALDSHRWLETVDYEGVQAELIESIPLDPANSVYGKRLSWIHPEIAMPLRVDFYRPGALEPEKRFTVQRVERVQGYWTETDSLMADLDSGHQTRLIAEMVLYDRELPDSLFSVRALEDPAQERAFRP